MELLRDSPNSEPAPVPSGPHHSGAGMLVVIPAYNESGRVGDVIRRTKAELPEADVLVVDDGSRDDTAREALLAGAQAITLPVNLGYGAALQTGYKHAIRHGYRVIGQIDADGQHSPAFFGPLLDELERENVDVCIGSRFKDRDGHYKPSAARRVGMALFARVASRVTRQHISDPTSGFQVLRRSVAEFYCSEVYPSDYPDADILILLHRSGFGTAEVGVQMAPPPGKSMHAGHRSLYYVYKMTLSIVVTLLRPPIHRD